ncbi:hypothetical protein KBTX_03835 [wastewater metagenome]|uniref:Uncharacterized protein n=2 Tax=unclassified sequences TaxID=12908 RepID=A0A5B8RIV6_9ZZZZ|nr:hypothetical protein KBTEX_03835 [uncultured organism]
MSAALSSRPTRPTAARCRSLRSRPRLTSAVPRYHGTAVPLLVGRLLLAADISGGVLTPAAPGPRVRPSPAIVPWAGGARRSPMSCGDVGCPEQATYAANRGPMPVSPVTTSFDIARAPVPWHGRSPAVGRLLLAADISGGVLRLRRLVHAYGRARPLSRGRRRPAFSDVARGCRLPSSSRPTRPTAARCRSLRSRPRLTSPVPRYQGTAVPLLVGRLLLAADISGGVLRLRRLVHAYGRARPLSRGRRRPAFSDVARGCRLPSSSRAVAERRAGAASPCRPWARARR